ncbi:aminotransferase class IV [Flagellimonas allohymeniacidonis]|uniref:branched-chain-amino-acid transaminase n=1 Tax=Flagellimonas allohymeniacidonis TaxID=2517819 RepID=A0A4V2HSP6_9FLAO|nr:aminotransferase class IV [Allomuricauda hymeniacidonis]TAI48610.1 aminotransferase class IV [Allomuricauda hymeniacidonis]
MVNFDGVLFPENQGILGYDNRAFKFGDGVFETLRAVNGTLFFWEDHYFRLMASMRMLRMEIPMSFTLEFLEEEILRTVSANERSESPSRVRLTVFRKDGGNYGPLSNEISYLIEVKAMQASFYLIDDKPYEVELYKDFYLNKDLLSNLKTTNKILNVVASVYASENGYDNCLLINTDKQVVEAINGNLFSVKGNVIKTPPLQDGCLNGIVRKKLMEIINSGTEFELEEASISPFELQKADELFITNSISGIIRITKYRKKSYDSVVGNNLLGKLNAKARLEATS